MSYVSDCNKSIKTIINEKMRCLDDFGICSYNDKEMRDKLKKKCEENGTNYAAVLRRLVRMYIDS